MSAPESKPNAARRDLSTDEKRAKWRAEGDRRRKRAFDSLQLLIKTLGGQCARCEGDETTPLTIDHVGGSRKWNLHAENPMTRVRRYWAEYHAGVKLRVLCLLCNTEDRHVRAKELEDAPF